MAIYLQIYGEVDPTLKILFKREVAEKLNITFLLIF